jgi:hypothetical protein
MYGLRMTEYFKWLFNRKQWVWWMIYAVQAIAFATSPDRWAWILVVMMWITLATMWNFSSDEWKEASQNWKELYFHELEVSEGYEQLYHRAKNIVLNKVHPENS